MAKSLLAVVTLLSVLGLAENPTTKPHKLICTTPTATVLKQVPPVFPKEAKAKHLFGTVLLQVTINKLGQPIAIKLVKGDPILAKAAIEGVKQWRWKPYELNGVPVEVETKVTVNFELRAALPPP